MENSLSAWAIANRNGTPFYWTLRSSESEAMELALMTVGPEKIKKLGLRTVQVDVLWPSIKTDGFPSCELLASHRDFPALELAYRTLKNSAIELVKNAFPQQDWCYVCGFFAVHVWHTDFKNLKQALTPFWQEAPHGK